MGALSVGSWRSPVFSVGLVLGLLIGGMSVDAATPAVSPVGSAVQSAWVPAAGGQSGATIWTLARDPNLPAIRYAGGPKGFARTTDSGAHWTQSNSGLPPGCGIAAILALRPTGKTLLGACVRGDYGNGLYMSGDRGSSWRVYGTGMPPNTTIYALLQGPGAPGPMVAGTDRGIYTSADNGADWSLTLHGTATILAAYTLAHDAFSAPTFYAGTSNGIYKSVDFAKNWFAIDNGFDASSTIETIAMDSTRKGRLYAGTENDGIYRSTNGGNSWQSVDGGPDHVYSLLVQPLQAVPGSELTPDLRTYLHNQLHPPKPKVLAAKTKGKGKPKPIKAVKPPLPETALLLAGTDSGVQSSLDAGDDWSNRVSDANDNLPSKAAPYRDLPSNDAVYFLLSFGRSAELLAAGSSDGVDRSTDLGRSWVKAGPGLEASTGITAIAVDPAIPGTVFYGTDGAGIERSQNSGAAVVASNDGLPDGASIADLLLQPNRHDRIYAALSGPKGGVYSSSDGSTWSLAGLPRHFINTLAADPHDPDTLYAGMDHDGIGWSADAGAHWQVLDNGMPRDASVLSLAINPFNSLNILAGTSLGLFTTLDQGETWTAAGKGLSVGAITSLGNDPLHRGLFLAGSGTGVYLSKDAGATWSLVGNSLRGVSINRLARDPLQPSTILAATDSGVFRSTDNGATWRGLDDGFPSTGPSYGIVAAGPVAYAGTPFGPYFLSPAGPVHAVPSGVFFKQTGHNIQAPFLGFWKEHGGVAVFGYPRTEAIQDGGLLVQYFQRARLEYHPASHLVVLTPLGTVAAKGRNFAPIKRFPNGPLRIYIPQTRHSIGQPFLTFWRVHGGAAVFGNPISEILNEENGDGTGNTYVLQYYQNARLEDHPEAKGTPFTIQLGLLGEGLLKTKGWLQ
jgi:photosystem II stability/assembly factor-like uncharacterized protein